MPSEDGGSLPLTGRAVASPPGSRIGGTLRYHPPSTPCMAFGAKRERRRARIRFRGGPRQGAATGEQKVFPEEAPAITRSYFA